MTCPGSYLVTVTEPCSGTQTVQKGSTCSVYAGTAGDFDYVSLTQIGAQEWQINTFKASGTCSGSMYFRNETASSDPVGSYCDWNGVDKDCSRGEASVVED